MPTLATRVDGNVVEFDTKFHTPGAMTALIQMVRDYPESQVFEIFRYSADGSETIGFVRSETAAQDYAEALTHQMQPVDYIRVYG